MPQPTAGNYASSMFALSSSTTAILISYMKGIPFHLATSTTNDISPLLSFEFYEPVYYHMDDMPFPVESNEYCIHWVGVSENVGNFVTYKVLTNHTLKVIHHSNICSAHDPNSKNLCHDLHNDDPPKIIRSLPHQHPHDPDSPLLDHGETVLPMLDCNDEDNSHMAIVDSQELVRCTFLMDE